ncbi:hypothetical protein ACFVWY_25090 [Streptomyces sp. NPDC058195]|uniref:hypothetical protein n=1 Tax=Streptomyces sp. NPDC058195 TaxID=3346375 RepID=UPI0036E9EB8A
MPRLRRCSRIARNRPAPEERFTAVVSYTTLRALDGARGRTVLLLVGSVLAAVGRAVSAPYSGAD